MNLPDSTMNSCTCINSASFPWLVLFSIPTKRSLVVKLFKFAGKYLDLASTNIGQMFEQYLSIFSYPSVFTSVLGAQKNISLRWFFRILKPYYMFWLGNEKKIFITNSYKACFHVHRS